tara:strand:- start:1005 stop:2096 length:1092 start_codon:yes stop_codon:yes gene_type:complete
MPNYRKLTSTTLDTVTACTACAEPCGTSISIPSGAQGYYNLDFDAGSTASDTGAIIVYFNPQGIPDGIRVLYDSVYYNTVTNSSGRIQTPSGVTDAFTILGNTGNTCMPSSYPNTQSYTFYDGIVSGAWNNTGTTQSITINQGDYIGGGANQYSTLVIPKTSATPNVVSIQVLGHCATAWNVLVSCPAALPSVLASTAQSTDACNSTQSTYVYFAKNYNDTNTAPIVGNFVFTDENGATPLNNTSTVQYYITGTIAFSVLNGVVVSSGTCSGGGTPLTPFFATAGTSSLNDGRCGYFCDTLLYHNGIGTLPQTGDIIYSGSTTGSSTVTWTDYRGFENFDGASASTTGIVNASGVIQTIYLCP